MYDWPQRKKLRLKDYDYSSDWYYFITICTKNREEFFGEIVNWEMCFNIYWNIAEECWNNITNHYENIKLDEFVIMPNHIHGIIIVGNDYYRYGITKGNENIHSLRKSNISNIIKGFKIWVTKKIRDECKDFNFGWQKSFFDVIIKNQDQLGKTRQYILENPLKWSEDKNNVKIIK